MTKKRGRAEILNPDYEMHGQKEVFCGRDCSGVGQQVYDRTTVFQFLVDYILAHCGPPSYRQIGEACGISSSSMVRHVLDDLEAEGKILLPPKGQSRGLKVVGMRMVFEG